MLKERILLIVLCSFFTIAAYIDHELTSLLGNEACGFTQQEDVTHNFITFLQQGASVPPNIKAFEITKSTGQFMVIVTDSAMTRLHAKLKFSYRLRCDMRSNKNYNVGYIELLHVVNKDIRKSGIGSALLRYTLNKDYTDVPYIELYAYPFDYTDPIERSEKLPKLLGFYQRHGGIITHQHIDSADLYFDVSKHGAVPHINM